MRQSIKFNIFLCVLVVGFLVSHQEVESCGFTREAAIALLRRINETFPNLIQQQYPSPNTNSNSNPNRQNSNGNQQNTSGQNTNSNTSGGGGGGTTTEN